MEELNDGILKEKIVVRDLQRRVSDCIKEIENTLLKMKMLRKSLSRISHQSLEEIEIRPDTPIKELGFSVKIYNCLRRGWTTWDPRPDGVENIDTLGELLQCTEEDLFRIRHFGPVGLEELKAHLAELGLELAKEPAIDPEELEHSMLAMMV